MLKPGPTTPVSVTFALEVPVADAGSEIAAIDSVSASSVRYMETLSRFFTRERAVRFFYARAGGSVSRLRRRNARHHERAVQPLVLVGTVAVRARREVERPGRSRLGGDLRPHVHPGADQMEVLRGRRVTDHDPVLVRLQRSHSRPVRAGQR